MVSHKGRAVTIDIDIQDLDCGRWIVFEKMLDEVVPDETATAGDEDGTYTWGSCCHFGGL